MRNTPFKLNKKDWPGWVKKIKKVATGVVSNVRDFVLSKEQIELQSKLRDTPEGSCIVGKTTRAIKAYKNR